MSHVKLFARSFQSIMDKDTILVSFKKPVIRRKRNNGHYGIKKNALHCHFLEMNKEIKKCGGERRIIAQILYTCHLDLLRSETCENLWISLSTILSLTPLLKLTE